MSPLAEVRVRDLPWVALDLEMTGLDPVADRICELGLVRGDAAGISSTWSTLVAPGTPVTLDALRVHGLRDAELVGAPSFGEVADALLDRLDGAVWVAHHVDLDRAFLTASLAREGRALPAGCWVDTLEIARRLLVLPRHRLGDVCRAFGVELPVAHRALQDATATFTLFRRMLDVLDPDGDLTVGALCRLVADLAPGSDWRAAQERTLSTAHADRRPVRVRYVSRDGDGRVHLTVRELEIWKIALPRLEGWCRLRQERRVFRLERMRSVELVDDAYDIPEFDARI